MCAFSGHVVISARVEKHVVKHWCALYCVMTVSPFSKLSSGFVQPTWKSWKVFLFPRPEKVMEFVKKVTKVVIFLNIDFDFQNARNALYL